MVDKDDGNNAKIQVNITDGDDADPKFSMDGVRLVADASKIDYDAMSDGVDVYTLTVSVQDTPDAGSALATAVLVIVTVRDQPAGRDHNIHRVSHKPGKLWFVFIERAEF